MGTDTEATEQQLVAPSDERRRLPSLLAPLVLPALGAAAVVAMAEQAGGDFAGWQTWQAVAAPVAAFLLPAALSVWFARRHGVVEAAAWAIVCVAAQVALVFGVGFLALGYGPD